MMEIKIKYLVEEMRVKQNISKHELSRRTGLQYAAVSGLCNGTRCASPKLSTLAIYAKALNCQVKDLFTEIKE